MSEGRRRWQAPSATPWDDADASAIGPAQAMVAACHRDIYRYRHASAALEGEAEFFNSYARESCPLCNSADIVKKGHGIAYRARLQADPRHGGLP